MRSKHAVLAGALLIVAVAGGWLLSRPNEVSPTAGDAYDYAAAFESLDPSSRAPLFRIADVAGRDETGVAAVLGPPWQCASSRYSRRCSYAPGATEIVYIDGKADWLTVTALGDAPLDEQLLMRIGLQPTPPGTASDEELQWTSLGGLREVRAHGTPERAQFLRIKVKS